METSSWSPSGQAGGQGVGRRSVKLVRLGRCRRCSASWSRSPSPLMISATWVFLPLVMLAKEVTNEFGALALVLDKSFWAVFCSW